MIKRFLALALLFGVVGTFVGCGEEPKKDAGAAPAAPAAPAKDKAAE